MALECYLKGVLVSTGVELVGSGRLKSGVIRNHNLPGIAELITQKIGLEFSGDEISVLTRLAFWIESGRYPVTSNWEKFKNLPDCPGAEGEKTAWWIAPKDEEVFYALIRKLGNAYSSRHPA